MQHTPVNFLDKLKFEIAKTNNPQYFFQFWAFTGEIDEKRLQAAFKYCYHTIPKLNTKLTFQDYGYHYLQQNFEHNFLTIETSNVLIKELQKVLEQDLSSLVDASHEAPIILLKIQDTLQKRFVICLMINHIYCDANSAYLFMECLSEYYNTQCLAQEGSLRIIQDPVEDTDFVSKKLSSLNSEEKLLFQQASAQQLENSAYFFSGANEVKKIYNESTSNDVYYSYFQLPLTAFAKPQDCSVNSVVSALIADAFLTLKGEQTNQAVSISIAANARSKDSRIFGNYVTAIPIQLEKNQQQSLLTQFQQQMTGFKKNSQALFASYSRLVDTFKNINAEHIGAGFAAMSSKYHFYISNYGLYNPQKQPQLFFSNCQLETAGGFNFPLQAHFGLIFTLVPFNDSMGISIACSPAVFSKNEMMQFQELIQQKLKLNTQA